MAPEVYDRKMTVKGDIWSLGMTMIYYVRFDVPILCLLIFYSQLSQRSEFGDIFNSERDPLTKRQVALKILEETKYIQLNSGCN